MKSLKTFVSSLHHFPLTNNNISVRALANHCGKTNPISLTRLMQGDCIGENIPNGPTPNNPVAPFTVPVFPPQPDLIEIDYSYYANLTLIVDFTYPVKVTIPVAFIPEPRLRGNEWQGYPRDQNNNIIFPQKLCGIRVFHATSFHWADKAGRIIEFFPGSLSQAFHRYFTTDEQLEGIEFFAPFRSFCDGGFSFPDILTRNRPNAPDADFEGTRLNIIGDGDTYIEFITSSLPERPDLNELLEDPLELYREFEHDMVEYLNKCIDGGFINDPLYLNLLNYFDTLCAFYSLAGRTPSPLWGC